MDRVRCIQRYAPSVASTLLSPSGQLGRDPYIAVIVSVKCDGKPGRGNRYLGFVIGITMAWGGCESTQAEMDGTS